MQRKRSSTIRIHVPPIPSLHATLRVAAVATPKWGHFPRVQRRAHHVRRLGFLQASRFRLPVLPVLSVWFFSFQAVLLSNRSDRRSSGPECQPTQGSSRFVFDCSQGQEVLTICSASPQIFASVGRSWCFGAALWFCRAGKMMGGERRWKGGRFYWAYRSVQNACRILCCWSRVQPPGHGDGGLTAAELCQNR